MIAVSKAIIALKEGLLVAIPTETVYGLAANAENEKSIRSVFELKQRPLNHPLILHVADQSDLRQWVEYLPDYAEHLIRKFWPGPLTLVLKAKKGAINPLVTGGQSTVAIRCPNHPLSQQLLKSIPFPLVAPSANPFGKLSPTTAQHVKEGFPNHPLLILDGGRCTLGIESTIIDATNPTHYQILRHGLLSEEDIAPIYPHQQVNPSNKIAVPGRLVHHYQPNKPMYRFEWGDNNGIKQFIQSSQQAAYVLSFSPCPFAKRHYQWADTSHQFAYELYEQLHRADASEADYLIAELPPEEPQWAGVRERLIKASFPSNK